MVRGLLGTHGVHVQTVRRTFIYELPFPPRKAVNMFREYFGPMKTAFSTLDPTTQTAYAEELERPWSEYKEDENGKTINTERISGSYWNATVAPDGTRCIPVAFIAQTIGLASTWELFLVCTLARMRVGLGLGAGDATIGNSARSNPDVGFGNPRTTYKRNKGAPSAVNHMT